MKFCIKCAIEKPLSEFHNNITKPDGKATYCKPCNNSFIKPKTKEQSKIDTAKWLKNNPEKRKQIWQNYYNKNKVNLKAKRLEYNRSEKGKEVYKKWYEKYKPIQSANQRMRRKKLSPQQIVSKAVRDRFCKIVIRMKRGVKFCSWRDLIGCNVNELRFHLEKQFKEGMNWSNHGNGAGFWNIDHIRPLVKFNLMDYEEQKKAFHYTNTRPLWFEDNMKRNRKNHVE